MFSGARVSGNPKQNKVLKGGAPVQGGGVPGCLGGLRGERVKKKKKKIRVRENEAGFIGEG